MADAGYGVSGPFRDGLQERGLHYIVGATDEMLAFEGRSWRGFHHHACLVMLACGSLALEQWRVRRGPARPGKKG